MSAPLAYLITWTTYGSWLPGDNRGWVSGGTSGIQAPDPERRGTAQATLVDAPVLLEAAQREVVEQTIRDHCAIRGWELHAVNVRTNHVHLVVTADVSPEEVMNQLKAWCSRRLNEQLALRGANTTEKRKRWWTQHGSTKWINEAQYLRNAIRYVNERQ